MHSFVVDGNKVNKESGIITIDDGSDINHMKNVLRLKDGDEIRVVDGKMEYFCKITSISKKEAEAKIDSAFGDGYSLNVEITAGVGLIKNDRMDLIIQKLTEIGVAEIIPVITKRGVVKVDGKKDKWDIISKEAQKQCRGVKNVKIAECLKLNEIDFSRYDTILVPFEKEEGNSLMEVLAKVKEGNKKIKKMLYITGPEGGFEDDEIKFLKEKGALTLSLGKRILRAETASIVLGGILANVF